VSRLRIHLVRGSPKLLKVSREHTRTRTNTVNADPISDLLVAQSASKGDDGALGACVLEEIGAPNVWVYRGAGDDGVAASHVRQSVLGKEEEGMDICVESLDLLLSDSGVSATSSPNMRIHSTYSGKSKIVSRIIWKP
jgi:hypothetical protein